MTKLECHNQIATLTLDNPPDNRLVRPDFIELGTLDKFLSEQQAKALIITGTGRHFSSGADIETIRKQSDDEHLEIFLNRGKELLNYLYQLNIPVISAIEGVCFGGGLEIALSTHIRVVSEKALMAFPETMHDLMPGLGGNYLIKKHMTMGQSIELILCNNILDAAEARQRGLADYICPAKQTLDFSYELAHKMTAGRRINVIRNVMIAVKNAYSLPREEAFEEETRLFCQLAKELQNDSV